MRNFDNILASVLVATHAANNLDPGDDNECHKRDNST